MTPIIVALTLGRFDTLIKFLSFPFPIIWSYWFIQARYCIVNYTSVDQLCFLYLLVWTTNTIIHFRILWLIALPQAIPEQMIEVRIRFIQLSGSYLSVSSRITAVNNVMSWNWSTYTWHNCCFVLILNYIFKHTRHLQ